MGSFSLSPVVEIKESVLSQVVPAVSTSIGAFAGDFAWGPVDEWNIVDSENTLVNRFGKPTETTAIDWMIAASFLAYATNLKLVRVIGTGSYNAGYPSGTYTIKNETQYEMSPPLTANYVAKYPGVLGNSLKVSMADSSNFNTWPYRSEFGTATTIGIVGTTTNASTSITAIPATVISNIVVGSVVTGTGIPANTTVVSVNVANTSMVISNAATATGTSVALSIVYYSGTPGTTKFVSDAGGSNDEMHIVVVDEDGLWTGVAGTVLERYTGVSKAVDAKDFDNMSNYYVTVLNRGSSYVWFGGLHVVAGWASAASNSTFASIGAATATFSLVGGTSVAPTVSQKIAGYSFFSNPDEVDVSLIIGAGFMDSSSQTLANQYVIQNIAAVRRDCVAFVSPPGESVINNPTNEISAIINHRNQLPGTSTIGTYGFMDSGWKMMYDRYNDKFRWVPLCGDMAGLCAYTDLVADPWFAPGGFNRGGLKNVVKLAYNPKTKAERDTLAQMQVNCVVNFAGFGPVLYDNLTLQQQKDAFADLNVRRLFITMEKAISTYAKFLLFEFNDVFTRTRFVNQVSPYLRDIQGRRGITDFKVIADETVNTPVVIENNQFVGKILVKPARAIRVITLNFVAAAQGVSFDEQA
jgi:hypothetical protein